MNDTVPLCWRSRRTVIGGTPTPARGAAALVGEADKATQRTAIPQDTEDPVGAAAGAAADPEPIRSGYGRGRPGREAPLRRLKRHVLVRTAGGGAADGAVRAGRAGAVYPRLWAALPVLRGVIPGGLLLLALGPVGPGLAQRPQAAVQASITCEAAALLASLGCLGDCVYAALGYGEQLPAGGRPGHLPALCLWGQLLAAKARLAGFRLADLGGEPPYNVSVTPAGACKQQGTAEGFYRLSRQPGFSYRWQIILTPLALAGCLHSGGGGVLRRGGAAGAAPVDSVSALLSGGLPLALPVGERCPCHR